MYYCVKRVKLACLIDNAPLLTAGAGLGEVLGTIEKALYKRPPSLSAQPGQCTCVGPAVCALITTPPLSMFITSPLQETWVSAGMKMVLVFNKAILQSSYTWEKNCGGGKHNRPCQIYFSPKAGRDKGNHKHTSQTQRICVHSANSSQ